MSTDHQQTKDGAITESGPDPVTESPHESAHESASQSEPALSVEPAEGALQVEVVQVEDGAEDPSGQQSAEPFVDNPAGENEQADKGATPEQSNQADPAEPLQLSARWPWKRTLLIAGPAVALVAAGGLLLTSTSSPLPISEVQVSGASAELEKQVSAAVAGFVDGSFRSVDYDALGQTVGAIDGVGSAAFDWAWPSALAVTVVEQVPFAMLGNKDDGFVILDRDGQEITKVQRRPKGLPLVAPTDDPDLAAAQREVLAALSPDLLKKVRRVAGDAPDDLVIFLANGTKVRWGSPSESALKSQVLSGLLGAGASEISVEVPSRPALSGLPNPEDSANPQE